jgi:hypothetical protein
MRPAERSTTLVSFASAKTHARPKEKTKTDKDELKENARI